MADVQEALASIQADNDWAHMTLTAEIERLRAALGAIAAENEACWKAVLALSVKELAAHESATADVTEYTRHLTRHAALGDAIAAIRARRDDG